MTSSVNHYDLVICANNKSAVVKNRKIGPKYDEKNVNKHKYELCLIVLTG